MIDLDIKAKARMVRKKCNNKLFYRIGVVTNLSGGCKGNTMVLYSDFKGCCHFVKKFEEFNREFELVEN